MLNLLIAIMSDSYGRVAAQQRAEALKERAILIVAYLGLAPQFYYGTKTVIQKVSDCAKGCERRLDNKIVRRWRCFCRLC